MVIPIKNVGSIWLLEGGQCLSRGAFGSGMDETVGLRGAVNLKRLKNGKVFGR